MDHPFCFDATYVIKEKTMTAKRKYLYEGGVGQIGNLTVRQWSSDTQTPSLVCHKMHFFSNDFFC